MLARLPGPQPHMRETQMKLWTPSPTLAVVNTGGVNPQMERLCFCLSGSLCYSNKLKYVLF